MLRNRKALFKALRWTATIAMIVLLLWLLDWRASLAAVLNADWRFVLASVLISLAGVAISCIKWLLLLQALGISARFRDLMRWYFIGTFANNFLPTDVGGDVVRGVYTARTVGHYEKVALSIVTERLTGVAGLLGVAFFGALLSLSTAGKLPLVIAGAGVLALGALLAIRRSGDRLWRLAPQPLLRRISPLQRAWTNFKPALPAAFGLSLGFHLLVVVSNWVNLYALGTPPPFLPLLLLIPLVSLLGLLPIAINGWGVREGAFVFFLAQTGLSPGALLAGALLGRAVILLVSLLGAPLTLYEQRSARPISHL